MLNSSLVLQVGKKKKIQNPVDIYGNRKYVSLSMKDVGLHVQQGPQWHLIHTDFPILKSALQTYHFHYYPAEFKHFKLNFRRVHI